MEKLKTIAKYLNKDVTGKRWLIWLLLATFVNIANTILLMMSKE